MSTQVKASGCGISHDVFGWIMVMANPMDPAGLQIIGDSEKAIKVRNDYCGRDCWIPRAALVLRKPGVASYECEYDLRPWFFSKMSMRQRQVLNLAE